MELTKEIIKKIKKNDIKIINKLYMYSYSQLMSQIAPYKINDEDRKTIINNTFIKVIDNIHKFKPNSSYFSWIRQIAKHEIIDDYRRNNKHKTHLSADHEMIDTGSIPEINYQIEAEQLEFYLSYVPYSSRVVFNLYIIEGSPSKEICKDLNISYETFKWHMKNARKILRAQFRETENMAHA